MIDIKKVMSELTLEEKAGLCSGQTFWLTKAIERLGVPSVMMTDGPHGLRKEVQKSGGTNIMKGSEPSTCFPTAVTTASSWDRQLLFGVGKAIGEEAIDQGVSTVLGPGTNIKRSPLCGRNFEYFSEDPYLAGEMATAFIKGTKSVKVGNSLKHYAANNQEYLRMSIDAKVDERTLREIYLPAFETAVKEAQPQQVMCSYNMLNGEFVSDSKRMLNDILREEWGFEGIVVSDWGATNDRVLGIKGGLDLEMPGNKGMNDRQIVKAVNEGRLSMEELDVVVERMLRYISECAEQKAANEGKKADYAAHHQVARTAAAESAVLLKNDDNLLPLEKTAKVALIGKLAEVVRYQGSGSSHIVPTRLDSVLSAMDEAGVKYVYEPGYTLKKDGFNQKLLDKALEAAKLADKVVCVIGLTDIYESEGFDRTHMELPLGHNKLAMELLKIRPDTVFVLEGGSPVTLPWFDDAKAVLNMYLGGQAVGSAIVDLVFGDKNPCGKLAETYPYQNESCSAAKLFPMGPQYVEYRESIFVGYRWYDSAKIDVRFPFGYGLSYTTFEYSDLKLDKSDVTDSDTLTVSFKVTNTGKTDGKEICQVYVRDPECSVFKAEKELKGFEKVFVKAGETVDVSVTLNKRSFSFYNTETKDWYAEAGKYEILVGASSRDIRLKGEVNLTSEAQPVPDYKSFAPCYFSVEGIKDWPKDQFEALYGEKIPENHQQQRGEFTPNSSMSDVKSVPLGKFLHNLLTFGGKLVAGSAANSEMIVQSIKTMPLRAFSGFSGGILSPMTVDGLVAMLNKEKGGFRKFVAGFKKKNR